MPEVLHGLIQKSKRDAETLSHRINEAPDGWRLWLIEDGEWVYVGKLTSKRFVRDILLAQLTQEDR